MAKIGDNKNMTHLIRVVVAGDIPESQISVIAANFAEKNGYEFIEKDVSLATKEEI